MAAVQKIKHGTPSHLREAVTHVALLGRGPHFVEQSRAIIKDFLAQKFCTAMLESPEAQDVISKLYTACTADPLEVKK